MPLLKVRIVTGGAVTVNNGKTGYLSHCLITYNVSVKIIVLYLYKYTFTTYTAFSTSGYFSLLCTWGVF